MYKRMRISLLLLCFMLIGLSTVVAAEEKTVDGVLHIMNSATPSGGSEVLGFTEQWRLGGDDDEEIFGMIAQVLADEDHLYLLPCHVI